AAFSQLEADGLVTSHVGRGTFVNRPAALEPRRRIDLNGDPEAISRLWAPLFVDHRASAMSMPMMNSRHGAKAISFVAAAPPPDLFPAIDFRRCADSVLKRRAGEISRIGSADGLGALKSYLARWFTQNGMAAGEDEIVITTGCQQSMDLIRKLLLGPGDSLAIENPTYPGAVAALAPSPVERLQVPVAERGMDL